MHSCYSGSAALAAATLERWTRATGAPVFEGYGQTEAGPVLAFKPAVRPVRPGTVIQGVDVKTGERVLGPGAVGEVRARGPQVMRGYRNRPEETASALRGGWLPAHWQFVAALPKTGSNKTDKQALRKLSGAGVTDANR